MTQGTLGFFEKIPLAQTISIMRLLITPLFFAFIFFTPSYLFSQDIEDWIWYDPGVFNVYVNGLEIAPDGALWLSTGDKIVRFDGTDWETHQPSDDGIVLPDFYIRDMDMSPSGNHIWCSATEFAMRYDLVENTWTVFDTVYNATNPNTYDIAAENDQRVWWGTSGRLFEFDDPTWDFHYFYFPNLNINENSFRTILVDNENAKWITTSSSICFEGGCFTPAGLIYLNDTDTIIYDAETLGFPESGRISLCMNKENNPLIASNNISNDNLDPHYMAFENGTWQIPAPIPYNINVHQIQESPDGTIWVAGREHISGNIIVAYHNTDGSWGHYYFEKEKIKSANSMRVDGDGNLWLGGRSGNNEGVLGFLPARNFKAKGSIYVDENTNGNHEANEQGLANTFIKIEPGPQFLLSNMAGGYTASLPSEGDYQAKLLNPLYTTYSNPANGLNNINITTAEPNVENIDFGILPDYSVTDVSVNLIAINGANPGFETCYKLSFKNKAPQTTSGTINCTFDDILIFQNSSIPAATNSENNFTFNYFDLKWNETRSIELCFLVPADVSLLGEAISHQATISTNMGADAIPSDNQYFLRQTITGSYDPNFIEVNPKGAGNDGLIPMNTEILEYTIHFQNTGTDTARFITVTDSIMNDLEIISFEMIAASHNYELELLNNHLFRWTFNDINLPDSISNEKESHGFIKYKIAIKNNLPIGSQLKNKADIYFDFNPPIKTNETINTLYEFSITYIAEGATGSGTSWADASGDLQGALNGALPDTEIWVKEGIYYPTTCSDCDFVNRDTRFSIPSGVKLYGGFAGTETAIDQRDIPNHPTYLSGDIDQDGTLENNSFTVVYTFHVSDLTEVDGFIITGGNADASSGLGTPQSSGAGWFNTGATNGFSSNPTIRNCRFENNYASGYGGGMLNDGSFSGNADPVYTNCIFLDNTSVAGGGAIFNTGSFNGYSSPEITDCVFENNECVDSDGGAIFNIGSENGTCNPAISGCDFKNNTAGHDGGAIYSFGKNGNSSPVLTDCVFENNMGKEGGAIYNDGTFGGFNGSQITDCLFVNNSTFDGDGGAIYNSGFLGTCNPILMNCSFEDNTSVFAGGAVFNNGVEGVCNPTITNCRFLKNEAITFGGSMYNQGRQGNASPTITNCVFAENTAVSAGAIYNLGSAQGNANAVITNCTFYKNTANVCGAIYCNAGEDTSGIASPIIANSIFWENTATDIGDIFRIINGTPTISYSLVDKADCDDLYNGNGGVLNCNGGMVFNENPLFVNAANGNFHLATGSPSIDYGNNMAVNQTGISVDLDNLPRIFNGTVDLGVFEFGSTAGNGPTILQQPLPQVVCIGEAVTLSVIASGNQLTYQWFRNGEVIDGEEESILFINVATLADQGNYTCLVTNEDGGELSSTAATLTVNEPVEVSLEITPPEETTCEGELATFMAVPQNGGTSPSFQWSVNGNLAGSNSTIYEYAPQQTDTIQCIMVSSLGCVLENTVTSDPYILDVIPNKTPVVLITPSVDSTICMGMEVVFATEIEHGGSFPVYEWRINGTVVGGNDPSFTTNTLNDGDAVACYLTSSLNCLDENPVVSNELVVSVDSCSVNTTVKKGGLPNVRLYPNPSDGRIFVEILGLTGNFTAYLLNTHGQILMSNYEGQSKGSLVKQEINLTHLPQGIYYFQIITDRTITTKRLVVY